MVKTTFIREVVKNGEVFYYIYDFRELGVLIIVFFTTMAISAFATSTVVRFAHKKLNKYTKKYIDHLINEVSSELESSNEINSELKLTNGKSNKNIIYHYKGTYVNI